jgi:hypothetical protein
MENQIELEYDKPVEVSKTQLREMMRLFGGIIAGREDEKTGKCYIKIWLMKYKPQVELYLNTKK